MNLRVIRELDDEIRRTEESIQKKKEKLKRLKEERVELLKSMRRLPSLEDLKDIEDERRVNKRSRKLDAALRDVFGFKEFRPGQKLVCLYAMFRRDILAMFSTGFGKSLMFQLPAILKSSRTTVVVVPLLALMSEHFEKMYDKGIRILNFSELARERIVELKNEASESATFGYQMLFTTPEKLSAHLDFFQELGRLDLIERFVVDEAQCLLEWGPDFREDYLKLGENFKKIGKLPITALSASVNPLDSGVIMDKLEMDPDAQIFVGSFNRPNLYYIVRQVKENLIVPDFFQQIESEFGIGSEIPSGIIYVRKKSDCERYADEIREYIRENYPAVALTDETIVYYHSGIEDRDELFKRWLRTDKIRIVIATVALGMGIDKRDLRFVAHFTLPHSLGAYYQESGRAGREGQKALCILYYSESEYRKLLGFEYREKGDRANFEPIRVLENYCTTYGCRRKKILKYFGEELKESPEHCCDNCSRLHSVQRGPAKRTKLSLYNIPASKEAAMIREFLEDHGPLTVSKIFKVLSGSKARDVSEFLGNEFHGSLQEIENTFIKTKEDMRRLIRKMVRKGLLREDLRPTKYGGVSVRYDYVYNPNSIQLLEFLRINVLAENGEQPKRYTKFFEVVYESRSGGHKGLKEYIKKEIAKLSLDMKIGTGVYLSDKEVDALYKAMPISFDALEALVEKPKDGLSLEKMLFVGIPTIKYFRQKLKLPVEGVDNRFWKAVMRYMERRVEFYSDEELGSTTKSALQDMMYVISSTEEGGEFSTRIIMAVLSFSIPTSKLLEEQV